MARETVTRLIDDIDGSPARVTIQFAVNNVEYSIDLSSENARMFEKSVEPYITAGRRISTARAARKKATSTAGFSRSRLDLAAIRDWAIREGHNVADRGRIPGVVIEAFHAAENAVTHTLAAPALQATAGASKKAPARSEAAKKVAGPKPEHAKADVRDWAAQHGYTVAARGRIPAEVTQAHAAAQEAERVTVAVGPSSSRPPRKSGPRKSAAPRTATRKAAAKKGKPAKRATAQE
ncbi:MAG: hypothetical protein QOH56_1640 [Pseudonocardiales bacterium]|jgi:hypothetical protein|nr:hypothetical protein [Pseudonocardiales bacterium]